MEEQVKLIKAEEAKEDKDHLAAHDGNAERSTAFTPGPWRYVAKLSPSENHRGYRIYGAVEGWGLADVSPIDEDGTVGEANAALIASAPTMYAEMRRYLPVLARLECMPEVWQLCTAGLGIATINGYVAALSKARGEGQQQ